MRPPPRPRARRWSRCRSPPARPSSRTPRPGRAAVLPRRCRSRGRWPRNRPPPPTIDLQSEGPFTGSSAIALSVGVGGLVSSSTHATMEKLLSNFSWPLRAMAAPLDLDQSAGSRQHASGVAPVVDPGERHRPGVAAGERSRPLPRNRSPRRRTGWRCRTACPRNGFTRHCPWPTGPRPAIPWYRSSVAFGPTEPEPEDCFCDVPLVVRHVSTLGLSGS